MIPFAASAARYSEWLRILCKQDAETPFPSVGGKEQARAIIDGEIMLSVPVIGGGGRLKRECGPEIMISGHGRWQEVHLGAIKALYGKTPYFPHLFPELEKIYRERSCGALEDFNKALHQLALQWLGIGEDRDRFISEIRRLPESKKRILRRLAEEAGEDIDMNHSIFGLLFRLGKESLFALIGKDL